MSRVLFRKKYPIFLGILQGVLHIRDFWDLENLVLRETSLAETMINQGFSGPKNRVNIGLYSEISR